ncbi:MAG TPA: PAS domain S-box protein [Opitutus sp.]|nr:PAS domain S-box protein [Opitutus sp.]
MKDSSSFLLTWGGALLTALLIVMAGAVLFVGGKIEQHALLVESDSVPGLINAHTIRSAYSEGFACALQALDKDGAAPGSPRALRLAELDATARGACDDYRGTIHIDPVRDTLNFEAVLAARDEFLRRRGQFLGLVTAGRRDEAQQVLVQPRTPAYDALMRACDVLVTYNNRTGTAFSGLVLATVTRLRWIVFGVIGLTLASALVMANGLRRWQRVERSLRESERKFATAFKLSPHAMVITRRRDGVILTLNDAFQRAYGQGVEELVGRSAAEIGVWDSPADREAMLQTLDRDGHIRDLLRARVRPDGRKYTGLVSIEPLTLGAESCLLAVVHDITERVAAEQALERTVAEFSAIFDGAATGIVLVDRDSRAVRWNQSWARFLGYGAEEMEGMRIADYTHPEDVNKDLDRFQKLLGGTLASYQIEKRFIRKDRAVVWGRLTTSVVRGADEALIFGVGLIEDITEHKRAELALRDSERERARLQEQLIIAQKLEALGRLAGGVAHDFNNLLAAIMLYLDVFKTDPAVSPPMQEALGELTKAARRAAALTRQLLLFSRREPAQRQVIDLNELAANLLNMLGRLIGSHLELRHEPAPEPLWVLADSGMLEQVTMNLVVNARDAMPRGGTIVLRLDAVEFDAAAAARHAGRSPGRFVRLTVRDAGSGMSPEVQAHIFEPFFTTKEAGKGTGLGLSTVLGIVQQHHGWVEVDSAEGRGSTFAVCLPAHSGQNAAAEAEAATEPPARGGRETVLVAEDNEQLRTVTARILRQAGYTVLEVASGRAAQDVLDADGSNVDLLLSDIVMPGGVFGHELASRLRAEGRRTRVILMSAQHTVLDPAAIQAAGGVYLAKPFDTARLLHVVRATLDGEAAPA